MDQKALQKLLAEIAILAAGQKRTTAVQNIVAYLEASDASIVSIAMIKALHGLAKQEYNEVLLLLRPLCQQGHVELLPFAAIAAKQLGLANEAEQLTQQAKATNQDALVAFADSFIEEHR